MTLQAPLNSFAALRQFARKKSSEERCEMCSAAVFEGHAHLVEPVSHKLMCVCEPCALLFSSSSAEIQARSQGGLVSGRFSPD